MRAHTSTAEAHLPPHPLDLVAVSPRFGFPNLDKIRRRRKLKAHQREAENRPDTPLSSFFKRDRLRQKHGIRPF